MQRGFQFFARSEVVALQDVFDTTVEALDHAVCLGRSWRGQTVFDIQFGAELVELMLARRSTLAQAEEAIGELFSVVRENRADADRAGTLKIAQEAPGIRSSLCLENADENPPCRPVDGHEEVAARSFVSHLGQILHVDVDIARLVSLEGAVFGPRRLCLQVTQVADAMPTQTAVQTRARDVRVQEFSYHRQKIIERHQQRLAKGDSNCHLCRVQCRLQPVRRVTAIMNVVTMLPLIHGLFVCRENDSLDRFLTLQTAEPLSQD